jgi:hypothetical protein
MSEKNELKRLVLKPESELELNLLLIELLENTPEFMSLAQVYSELLLTPTQELLNVCALCLEEISEHPESITLENYFTLLLYLERYSSLITISMPRIAITLCNLTIMVKMKLLRLKEMNFYKTKYH